MTREIGITAYGAYVPASRLRRSAIAAAHLWSNPAAKSLGRGERSFASWDEDVITMAVAAARDALPGGNAARLHAVILASTTAPFADRSNAGVLAGALGIGDTTLTLDAGGSQRAGVSALIAGTALAVHAPVLVASADRRNAKPGSAQEFANGDAAAAIVLGTENIVARLVGSTSLSRDFVDHWREADQKHDYHWEERWIRDEGYLKIVPATVTRLLTKTGITAAEIDYFILPSPLRDIESAVARALRLKPGAVVDNLSATVGYTGAAHGLLLLAQVLQAASPGARILLSAFGNGCEAMLFEVTDQITQFKPRTGMTYQVSSGHSTEDYMRFLSFNGEISIDWGARAEFGNKYALTAEYRASHDMLAFIAGRDRATGVTQFPKTPISVAPDATGPAQYEDVPLADAPARIVSFTADWLTYHPDPPFYFGLVQFDNGARVLMEIVGVHGKSLVVGQPVDMVFRIKEIDHSRHYRHYFWKAQPISGPAAAQEISQ